MSQLLEKIKYTWREHGGLVLLGRAIRYLFRKVTGYRPPVQLGVEEHPKPGELALMREDSRQWAFRPLVSILLPVYDTDEQMLREVLGSVADQAYENWELCIVDDASSRGHVKKVVEAFKRRFQDKVKTIFREVNGHISASSNDALGLATGEYLALLDHDDLLAPHALYEVVRAAAQNRKAVLFYSNEDKIDALGNRFDTTYKAAWSPDQFLSFMYMGHLSVYRTDVVRRVGGFRVGFEGSQDFDLALRAIGDDDLVVHIPKVLYHWRTHPGSVAMNIHAKPYAFKSGIKAVTEAAQRQGYKDVTISMPRPGIYDIKVQHNQRIRIVRSISEIAGCVKDDWIYVSGGLGDGLAVELLSRCISDRVGALAPVAVGFDGRIVAAGIVLGAAGTTLRFNGARQEEDGYGARLVTPSNVSAVGPWGLLVRGLALRESSFDDTAFSRLSEFEKAIYLSACLKKAGWRLVCHGGVRGVFSSDLSPRISTYLSPVALGLISSVDPLFFGPDPFYPPGLSINPPNFQRAA